jgi:hypothetical protein
VEKYSKNNIIFLFKFISVFIFEANVLKEKRECFQFKIFFNSFIKTQKLKKNSMIL